MAWQKCRYDEIRPGDRFRLTGVAIDAKPNAWDETSTLSYDTDDLLRERWVEEPAAERPNFAFQVRLTVERGDGTGMIFGEVLRADPELMEPGYEAALLRAALEHIRGTVEMQLERLAANGVDGLRWRA
jgi:hypothetical protein